MPSSASATFRWRGLAAVSAAYVVIVFVLCPGTRFIGFPVHHDDFNNLAHVSYRWYPLRPVSTSILFALSELGIPAYYAALHVLIVAYGFLSLYVLRRLLQVPNVPVLLLLPIAAAMLSYENTIEYSRYTGLITSLLSGVFAVMAMTAMISTRALDWKWMSAAWVFAALSLWSKEDFLPAILLLAAYLTWQASFIRRWLVLLAGLLVEVGLLFLYNRHFQSVFTQSTSGTYKASFAPLSILKTAFIYSIATPGAKAALLLAAFAVVWTVLQSAGISWKQLLAFVAITSSIALPYLCLPAHVFPYYALTWTIWEAGGGLLLLWKLWPSVRGIVAISVLALVCLFVTQPGRIGLSRWYAQTAKLNRNVAGTLMANRAGLEPYPAIAVEGAPFNGPWFGADGEFIRNRLHLDHIWVVRVPREGIYLRTSLQLLGTPINGDVKTVALESEPVSPDLPLLRLSGDGTGTVEYPPANLGSVNIKTGIP